MSLRTWRRGRAASTETDTSERVQAQEDHQARDEPRAAAPGDGATYTRADERDPAAPPARRRTSFGGRTRDAGAGAVGAFGSGVMVLARLVMTVAALIALLIGLAIVLRDVDANSSNTIVKGIHDGANFFAGAFTGLITFNGHPKRAITVDWGIALVVYLIVGAVISSFIARIGRGGVRYERTHRAAPSH
ncbi:MAG TPA: hypothetical protein VLJ42_01975 [Solirubrobacteraceae bacterium]|nr:hypothetical protein [Solirubrobacteraceae bacterium]